MFRVSLPEDQKTWGESRMLEYYTGADISDFSRNGAAHNFEFYRFNAREPDSFREMRAAAAFDVILDDGSHMSFHQQQTLVLLWDKLKPGGLFIIEDLQWQPLDDKFVPKTAELLAKFDDDLAFKDHPLGAGLARIRANIAQQPEIFFESYFKTGGAHDKPKLAVLIKGPTI